jgi:peptidyl-prolyl cis-trans isomerase B (cyclophilin B)
MSERHRVPGLALLALLGAAFAAPQTTKPAPTPVPPMEAVVETDKGTFVVQLLADVAPRHVAYFIATARKGGYDGTTFHRIIPGGIIQGGDPLSKDPAKKALYGTGGLTRQPPWVLKAELSDRAMTRGAVAAVLLPGKPDSAGSQFFVCLSDQPSLTGKYTLFGEVVSGLAVADAIGASPVEGDKARARIEIKKVTIRETQGTPTGPVAP